MLDQWLDVRAISFDGDATLWDFERVMRHSLGYALAELRRRRPGPATEELTIERLIAIRNQVAGQLEGKIINLEEIRLRAFRRTVECAGGGDDALAADLNALYLEHRFEDIELYPDVIPTLDALAPRFTLGLLSNGNSYPERCGLEERFQFVVFAQDYGFEKPDRRLFEVALEGAGCAAFQLLHVGDSLSSDVLGAQNVGALAVWLNREGVPNETDTIPDREIASLAALPALLGSRR